MADYGAPLRFGLSVTPDAENLSDIIELTRAVEEAGLDLIAIQDHPYQPAYFDTWTLITHLAAHTSRIRFIPDVLNLALRPPAMLAKAAVTLDVLSGGRFDLAVGAGGYAPLVEGMGGTGLTGGALVAAAAESVQILRHAVDAALNNRAVTFSGAHHQVRGFHLGPAPAHRIPVWVGGLRPKMLALTGRYADGWICPINTGLPPEKVPEAQRIIDTAASEVGRQPQDVRRLYNILGSIGPHVGGPGLNGPVELWVDTLTEWVVDLGFDSMIFWPAAPSADQVRLFADEVVPQVRQRVAEIRQRK
ncbi:N5,N10-methylene tetrahydromethanopterin reductase [Planotetraspora thailandica]|uniref:N5,N10-methylene tetrahydromethanopterin reductase n=1 Tax=Planotetraspora thailandica TaxID=487172 RepID=A0A8J3V835_9ACTN|nr:LLM class flavin-dependent oxidoreductase [Planotetraspora thailandica]GII51765.1 N5,N10-methylene tetrahydromethanopterin reductase [Planotetraspora thailandica]